MDYRNVREQVTDRLREEVLLGKFEAGEALRFEAELPSDIVALIEKLRN